MQAHIDKYSECMKKTVYKKDAVTNVKISEGIFFYMKCINIFTKALLINHLFYISFLFLYATLWRKTKNEVKDMEGSYEKRLETSSSGFISSINDTDNGLAGASASTGDSSCGIG